MIEHGANIGFTAGNNLAMAHCDPGSDILMLNNDIVAEEPQWVERLQETAYSDPNIGIVGCRLRGDDGLVQHAGTFISRRPAGAADRRAGDGYPPISVCAGCKGRFCLRLREAEYHRGAGRSRYRLFRLF